MPVLSKEFFDIQITTDCGFTKKRVGNTIRTHSQIHRTDKYSEHSSIIWSILPTGWLFIHELKGSGFEASCSHLNFRFRGNFEQGAPLYWGNYRVWIHSETGTRHEKKNTVKCTVQISTQNTAQLFSEFRQMIHCLSRN